MLINIIKENFISNIIIQSSSEGVSLEHKCWKHLLNYQFQVESIIIIGKVVYTRYSYKYRFRLGLRSNSASFITRITD